MPTTKTAATVERIGALVPAGAAASVAHAVGHPATRVVDDAVVKVE